MLRNIMGAQRQRFDPFGAALLAAGFASLTLALSFAPEWGWSSWRFLVCFGVSVVALLAVPAVERRVRDPIIDLRLLQSASSRSALAQHDTGDARVVLPSASMLPFYFEELRGFSVGQVRIVSYGTPLEPCDRGTGEWFFGGSVWLALAGFGRIGPRMFRSGSGGATECSKLGLGHNMATRAHWCRPGPFHDSECTRADETPHPRASKANPLACCQPDGCSARA